MDNPFKGLTDNPIADNPYYVLGRVETILAFNTDGNMSGDAALKKLGEIMAEYRAAQAERKAANS